MKLVVSNSKSQCPSNPRSQARSEIRFVPASLSVMVHPHFDVSRLNAGQLIDENTLSLRSSPIKLEQQQKGVSLDFLKNIHLVHQLYRREIQRIAETQDGALALVSGEINFVPDEDFSDSLTNGIPRSILAELGSYQQKLIRYASELGDRFILVRTSERNVGAFLYQIAKEIWKTPATGLEVQVFGEWREACVSVVTQSLIQAGFDKSTMVEGKSLSRNVI